MTFLIARHALFALLHSNSWYTSSWTSVLKYVCEWVAATIFTSLSDPSISTRIASDDVAKEDSTYVAFRAFVPPFWPCLNDSRSFVWHA